MAEIVAFPAKPADRLRAALRHLDAALREQAEAVAEFRAELGGLRAAVDGLETGLADYSEALDRAAGRAREANAAARRLEHTAELWAQVPGMRA